MHRALLKEHWHPVATEKCAQVGLSAYRGEIGAPLLHRLLERQHYRLAYWRIAFSAVNYRRFFDITDLAGLRVEHPPTFRSIHALVMRLIAADQLQGLRLDHIDGLRDPARVHQAARPECAQDEARGGLAGGVLRRRREDSGRWRSHAALCGRGRHDRV